MDLRIEKMVYGGSGLSRLADGRVVWIPFSLPGEIVRVESILEKRGTLSAWLEEIVKEGTGRISAPCKYYRECGGCHYQHAAYETQLLIKQNIVSEQMERIAGGIKWQVRETVPSGNMYNYRNHVQFHVGQNGKLGFQRALSHEVVPIDACLLLENPLNDLIRTLNFDADTGLQRVAIRDDGIGTPTMLLTGESPNPPEFEVDFPLNVVYRGPAGDIPLSGETFSLFNIQGKTFRVSAGSFFQTNRGIAEKLVSHLFEKVKIDPDSTILDCYCGVGYFSVFLAEYAARMIGIESSEDACDDFVVNLDRYDNVELYQGNVEDVLPGLEIKPDLVVVDPPRAGIAPGAIKALVRSRPAQIAYISCEPSTLARDIKILVDAGYQIVEITPFDMFPQTYHIETMVLLSLAT